MSQAERDSEAPGRQRALRSDAVSSRKALLDAAKELFAERGPEALTLSAVARRAGLNRSTAYQHFRDRSAILAAVSGSFAREVREIFEQPRSFGDQIDFFVHYFRERPDIVRLWMFQLLGEPGGARAPGWDGYVASLEHLAKSPKSQDGIDAEMLGVIGLASALVWSLMAQQRSSDEEEAQAETRRFAAELKRLFLFGALRPEHWPELTTGPGPPTP